MASVLQTILDGSRNLVVKAVGSGAVATELIVDVSTYVPACTKVSILKIYWMLDAAQTGLLIWDATAGVNIMSLNATTDGGLDFTSFGGLINNAGAGITGDIKLTIVGAGQYTVILVMAKHGVIDLD